MTYTDTEIKTALQLKANYDKEWRRRNPDKAREIARRWREKNRDKVREYARQWSANHPEKLKEYKIRYWLKKAEEARA